MQIVRRRRAGSGTKAIILFTIAASIGLGPRTLGQVNVANQPTRIENIRIESYPNETHVVIQLAAVVRFTYQRLSGPDRLFMDLWKAQLSPHLKYGRWRVDDPLVSAINIVQTAIGIRMLLDLTFDGSYDVAPQSNPSRIVVTLRRNSKGESVPSGISQHELTGAERRARAEKSRQILERLASSRIPRTGSATASPAPAPATSLPNLPTAALAVPALPLQPTALVSTIPTSLEVAEPAITIAAGRTLAIPKVSRAPRLDDFVNEKPREAEVSVTDFRQREPVDGYPASQNTIAYLSYDEKNLYVVFVCKEAPDKIRARMAQREEISDDDQVSVYLDTFHDRQHAYVFSTNPLGIQQDGTFTEGLGPDYTTFDTLWHSKGKLTQDGFVVWIAVPFKSIRFADALGQTWGVALSRSILHNNENSFWPYITQRENSFVKQFAALEGLKDISTGHNVQIIPYGAFTRSDQTNAQNTVIRSYERRRGLDAKVVLGDRVSVDTTFNPDFSEIESDQPQVTINQRFEVFFPEKRPFFTENATLFQTPLNLFFSRRIADPEFGSRLTGKLGRWSVAALAANDRSANSSAVTTRFGAEVGVARVSREIGERSSVGVLALSRDFASTSSRVFSLDARINIATNWSLTAQTARSYDKGTDENQRSGPSYFGALSHVGQHFTYSTTYTDVSPDFRSPLGFIPRVDIRQSGQYLSYLWRPQGHKVISFGPAWTGMVNVARRGQVQDWYSAADFKVVLKGPTELTVQRSESFERFSARDFRKEAINASFSTAWVKWIGISAFYQQGTTINYSPANGQLPFLAGAQMATFATTLRPAARIRSEHLYIYSRLVTLPTSGPKGTIFNNHIIRWKTNFQFSRALSFRTIIDYTALLSNTSLFATPKYTTLTGDVLLRYLLNPGTALYIGYNTRYEETNTGTLAPAGIASLLSRPVGRQLFAKVSYLVRF